MKYMIDNYLPTGEMDLCSSSRVTMGIMVASPINAWPVSLGGQPNVYCCSIIFLLSDVQSSIDCFINTPCFKLPHYFITDLCGESWFSWRSLFANVSQKSCIFDWDNFTHIVDCIYYVTSEDNWFHQRR